jgi:hypothetical protein
MGKWNVELSVNRKNIHSIFFRCKSLKPYFAQEASKYLVIIKHFSSMDIFQREKNRMIKFNFLHKPLHNMV